MITTKAPSFGRILTAMVTPFGDDGKIDYQSVERIVKHLLATGTDSIVVAGTTGESPTLHDVEKGDLFKAVKQSANQQAKIILGTGSNSTAKSVESTAEAERLGADGVLVVAPYYNKPGQDGLIAHYEAVAGATRLPVIIYNIPGRTGVNITPDTIIEIAQRCPNAHALKDATGGVDQSAEIAGKVRDDFVIYSGDDNLTLPFLSIGAAGVVSVASHIIGSQLKAMIDNFFKGNLDEARRIHYQYLPLFKGLFTAPNPTCIKFALSVLGLCKPHLRLPLVPLAEAQQEAMKALLRQVDIKAKEPVKPL